MKILVSIIILLLYQLSVLAIAEDSANQKIKRNNLSAMMDNAGNEDSPQDLYRLCEPCEDYIDEFIYTKNELKNTEQQIWKQELKLKELDKGLSKHRGEKGKDAEYHRKLEHYNIEVKDLKTLKEQQVILLSNHERNENNLLKCVYQHCMDKDYADTNLDWNYTVWHSGYGDTKEYDYRDEWLELSIDELYQTLPIYDYYGQSPLPKRYLLTITSCKPCKKRSKEINDWILENYDEKLSLPDNLREDNYTKEKYAAFAVEARKFIAAVEKKRAELRQCEKQCNKKDKSHGSILPDKKIRYYAAAGVSHVKSEDLRESINAGKEIFAANGIDGDFNSDSHDLGHRFILGFEVPLENGSIVDVSVFFQDGIVIRGDVSGTAATMAGPFTFDSTGKQEIKTYGIDFSFLYKLTANLFLGGGLGYHIFDIVDESNVVTTLNGVVTSSVSSRDSEHESVVAATAKVRYNLGERIFIGGDVSRTLEEVGFNDDDHVTSVNAHVGVRF